MIERRTETVQFPAFSGVRCLMMPYIQGEPESIPDAYESYRRIVASLFLKKGDIGFLTIDESLVRAGNPHRGQRAKSSRPLHTEAGIDPSRVYQWGGGGWGAAPHRVTLDRNVKILIGSNMDNTCAVWDAEHEDTSPDGDIGHLADRYPYEHATFLRAGEIYEIGILTPHESISAKQDSLRQFIRIVSSGVHGREEYFTANPLL